MLSTSEGPTSKPALVLLSQIEDLVEGLSERPAIYDAPTRETFTLADPLRAQPKIRSLKPIVARLREACSSDYNAKTLTKYTLPR